MGRSYSVSDFSDVKLLIMCEPQLTKFAQVKHLGTSFRRIDNHKNVKSCIPNLHFSQTQFRDLEPRNSDKNSAVNLESSQLSEHDRHYAENDKFGRNKSVKKRSKSQDSGYDQSITIKQSSQGVVFGSAMQTLDRRISASSDQLDTLKKLKNREKPMRTRSSSRISFERKFESEDYHFERAKPAFIRGNGSKRSRDEAKTPFEMFLENDGPYSRKLFGPINSETSRRSQRMDDKSGYVYKGQARKEKIVYTNFQGSNEVRSFIT